MSQTALGDAVGLSFQQVQKYEVGANRIAGGRLAAAARVLDTTIAWLAGALGSAVLMLLLTRISLGRCEQDLRRWYANHHGKMVLD